MDKARKAEIIEAYKLHDGDTGSPEVQIAILSDRISHLTEHLKVHKKGPAFKTRPVYDGRSAQRLA